MFKSKHQKDLEAAIYKLHDRLHRAERHIKYLEDLIFPTIQQDVVIEFVPDPKLMPVSKKTH